MPRADRVHSTPRPLTPANNAVRDRHGIPAVLRRDREPDLGHSSSAAPKSNSTCTNEEQVEQPVSAANILLETPAYAEAVSKTFAAEQQVSAGGNCAGEEPFSAQKNPGDAAEYFAVDRLASDRLAALLQRPDKPTPFNSAELLRTLHRLRNEAAREVERLIELMDEIDADPDFEPSGDESEPELGSVEGRKGYDQSTWAAGADGEPILGSSENYPHLATGFSRLLDCARESRTCAGSQLGWSTGNDDDREICADLEEDDLHDGREPDVDDEPSGDELEPSLGSFDRLMNQDHGYRQRGGQRCIMHRNMDGEKDAAL